MYNKNICCHYMISYIMTTNILLYMKVYFLLYMKVYFSLYKTMYNDNKYFYYNEKYTFMYNDNKYFYYTSSCIIKIFVVIIRLLV